MNRAYPYSAIATASALLAAASLSTACSPKTSTRMVDDPTGAAVEYGAPKDYSYTTELLATRELARVTVFQSAKCDVIPVTVVQRYQETLHGDEVVQRAPITKKQVAGEPKGTVACDQAYARNVEVMLDIEGNQVTLGKTNKEGMVGADLASILQAGAYETAPQTAKVLVRPNRGEPTREIGSLDLSQLATHQARITELVAEMEAILAKGETGASEEEVARSYKIYAQLQEIGAADPRVEGLRARFWELFYGRKQEEAIERLGKNLEALDGARDLLKEAGAAAIPLYVQAAVNSGYLDRRALEWSSLRLIRALRGTPAACSAGFSFGAVPSYGWPADAQVASSYVNFGYGSNHAAVVQGACRTF